MRVKAGGFVAAVAVAMTMIVGGAASADDATTSSTTTSSSTTSTTSTTTTTTIPDEGVPGAAVVGDGATSSRGAVTAADNETDDTGAPATTDGAGGLAESKVLASRTGGAVQLVTPPPAPTTTVPPLWLLPANSGEGRRIVYSKTNMWVWAIEADGTIVKHHPVSGRLTWNQPLPGTYRVFSRSAYTCSIQDPSVCWRYMVRFTVGPGGDNIGFHEIPTNLRTGNRLQGDWQLGQPLSAGCVRQSTADALFIWNWAPVGTKVVVLP